ncbi:UPF0175 family protein [Parafilimonas terrae]|jgi:predicted HTH domain antitoxin|uniref:Predicted antitoxin, contains HTH domain n=1 Tax=Parafilimonas terrae TaxID=1465490 RepID=A0A1I5ZJA1_9BACT|nr:UPF0175 family protein [Parafilimonas terrae]SFQ56531.1 Predicted antitoxin, contains HTH domain [Parafilimonas terrae]
MLIELDIKDKASEADIRKEIALILYEKEIYSLGKAAAFAGLSKDDFMKLMKTKGIYIKYSIEDVKLDLDNLQFVLNDSGK